MAKIPSTKWARGKALLKTAAGIAVKEASARLPGVEKIRVRVEQTQLLVETLGQMKGAAMKVGQLLSIEGADIFPPEVIEVLSKLQGEGHIMPFDEVEEILKRELKNFADIKELSSSPIASASIGQVHSAQINGKPVAIKVQFPGVEETIDSDVDLLNKVLKQFARVTGKEADIAPLLEEIRHVLHQETDYESELRDMTSYREHFFNSPEFVIPKALPEFSTRKVLTMEFMEGERWRDWVKTATGEEKEIMGERVLELYLHEYLVFGLVQTDPNFGNFLVQGDGKLVLLDFGACKRFSPEFRESYRGILRATMARDKGALLKATEEFGLIDPRESADVREKYFQMMDQVVAPFRHVGLFDFGQETYSKLTREKTMAFAKALKFSPPPRDLVFLHRKLGGVFHMLKLLGAKMDLARAWERMMTLGEKGPGAKAQA